jgi:hypothetical protein
VPPVGFAAEIEHSVGSARNGEENGSFALRNDNGKRWVFTGKGLGGKQAWVGRIS